MVERGARAIARGLTLVEVMVALGLIAVSLMLVLGLIPAGVQSSQRAADMQAAASWSRQLIEDTPAPAKFPVPSAQAMTNHEQKIGATNFTATRKVTAPGPYLYRIEVETRWLDGVEPVRLSLTRYNPAGPEL